MVYYIHVHTCFYRLKWLPFPFFPLSLFVCGSEKSPNGLRIRQRFGKGGPKIHDGRFFFLQSRAFYHPASTLKRTPLKTELIDFSHVRSDHFLFLWVVRRLRVGCLVYWCVGLVVSNSMWSRFFVCIFFNFIWPFLFWNKKQCRGQENIISVPLIDGFHCGVFV